MREGKYAVWERPRMCSGGRTEEQKAQNNLANQLPISARVGLPSLSNCVGKDWSSFILVLLHAEELNLQVAKLEQPFGLK